MLIETLEVDGSPRRELVNDEHARLLAQVDGEALPAILVNRPTMRVIDGLHRIQAAKLRGQRSITASFVSLTEEDAFVMAVERNIAHGLPLTLAERKDSAAVIVKSHPSWSDRRIAMLAGLTNKTVGRLRTRLCEELPHTTARQGRDGHYRRLDCTMGRAKAEEMLRADPSANLSRVAQESAISLTTAKEVRQRMSTRAPTAAERPDAVDATFDIEGYDGIKDALEALRKDPSVCHNEIGRILLTYLNLHVRIVSDWKGIRANLPQHCAPLLSTIASRAGQDWHRLKS